jgi:hypothetical protein
VPSRLIGEYLKVRLYEDRVQARYLDQVELDCERLLGRNQHRVDYRHVIWSLVRKPGGFARYVYREEMFPSLVFRRAYDAITALHQGVGADLEYLRILHQAASGMQSDVEEALELLLQEGKAVSAEAVKALVVPQQPTAVPQLMVQTVDLCAYDALLGEVAA